MKLKKQGRKDYIVLINGKATNLFTINQAIQCESYHKKHGNKAEIVNYKEYIKRG